MLSSLPKATKIKKGKVRNFIQVREYLQKEFCRRVDEGKFFSFGQYSSLLKDVRGDFLEKNFGRDGLKL